MLYAKEESCPITQGWWICSIPDEQVRMISRLATFFLYPEPNTDWSQQYQK